MFATLAWVSKDTEPMTRGSLAAAGIGTACGQMDAHGPHPCREGCSTARLWASCSSKRASLSSSLSPQVWTTEEAAAPAPWCGRSRCLHPPGLCRWRLCPPSRPTARHPGQAPMGELGPVHMGPQLGIVFRSLLPLTPRPSGSGKLGFPLLVESPQGPTCLHVAPKLPLEPGMGQLPATPPSVTLPQAL